MEAYKRVKRNKGSAGVDGQNFENFESNLKWNLYKVWNRMSSGSYFPSPVKVCEIPKKSGGMRRLGIPTISDRIAQMTTVLYLQSDMEKLFHEDSYGYRNNKSALDAIGKARERCWRYDFVIEFDIKGLFDNINHELLIKAVRKHFQEPWILLYIERWLKAPFVNDGKIIERISGTPQGGVISPILANLFMHYAFDKWMVRNYPKVPFERYADDGIIHCNKYNEALDILKNLNKRFKDCKLELHPEKTKIIYCKDKDRKEDYPVNEFDFLGYTFKKRFIKDRTGRLQFNFLPAVSKKSETSFRKKIKELNIHKMSGSKIEMIAEILNPKLRGWINYFGKYNRSAIRYTMICINRRLVIWTMRKFKRFRNRPKMATKWLNEISKREPNMFVHWALGYNP